MQNNYPVSSNLGKKKISTSSTNFDTLKNAKILIVSGSVNYPLLKAALEKVNPSVKIVGRVTNDPIDSTSIGSFDQLPFLISQYQIEHILFCNDEIAIAQIISSIQLLPAGIQFSWHLSRTSSIISSNDKNSSGFFIPLYN